MIKKLKKYNFKNKANRPKHNTEKKSRKKLISSDSEGDDDESEQENDSAEEEAEISILQKSITRSGRAVKRRVIQGYNSRFIHLNGLLKAVHFHCNIIHIFKMHN